MYLASSARPTPAVGQDRPARGRYRRGSARPPAKHCWGEGRLGYLSLLPLRPGPWMCVEENEWMDGWMVAC